MEHYYEKYTLKGAPKTGLRVTFEFSTEGREKAKDSLPINTNMGITMSHRKLANDVLSSKKIAKMTGDSCEEDPDFMLKKAALSQLDRIARNLENCA